jgi:hypothetical protein
MDRILAERVLCSGAFIKPEVVFVAIELELFGYERPGRLKDKRMEYLSPCPQKASTVTPEFRLFLKELGKIRGSIGVKS